MLRRALRNLREVTRASRAHAREFFIGFLTRMPRKGHALAAQRMR
jgi:hypothetical protein